LRCSFVESVNLDHVGLAPSHAIDQVGEFWVVRTN
jgi:hypothetical protein